MTDSIRVFVNGSGIDIPTGGSAIDAVRAWNAEAAQEVTGGTRLITDSRGLTIDGSAPMSAGSILRLIAKRDRAAADEGVE